MSLWAFGVQGVEGWEGKERRAGQGFQGHAGHDVADESGGERRRAEESGEQRTRLGGPSGVRRQCPAARPPLPAILRVESPPPRPSGK